MNNFFEVDNKKKVIIVIGIAILICIAVVMYFENKQESDINLIDDVNEMQLENFGNENGDRNENNNVENDTIENEENKEKIAVHITGEVKKKGIIYLNKGQRIADAIEKAGGTTKNANIDKVNLAYVLEDGQKIYIPNKNEKNEEKEYITQDSGENIIVEDGNGFNKDNSNSKEGEKSKVNINTANQTELETLPGIGPSLAQRIIEYRNENGEFEKIEDIQNVKGIGDAKYNTIKDLITK